MDGSPLLSFSIMNRFSRSILGYPLRAFALLAFLPGMALSEVHWIESYPGALEQARVENKQVLLDFTGSDWCQNCLWMERGVLSTAEFADYAEKNLICVRLDFPHDAPQSDATRKQNAALKEQFRVDEFPTYIVVDSSGRSLGSASTTPWTWRFIEKLDMAIRPDRHAIDTPWINLGKGSGEIKQLVRTLPSGDKKILLYIESDFSSSLSHKMESEVFASTYFKRFAAQNLLLVRIKCSESNFRAMDSSAAMYLGGDEVQAQSLPALVVIDGPDRTTKQIWNSELTSIVHDDGARAVIHAIT